MTGNITAATAREVVAEVFDAATADSVLVISPSRAVFEAVIDTLGEDTPNAQLLGNEEVLKDVRDDFHAASATAQLVADEHLEVRVLPDIEAADSTLVTSEQLHTIVAGTDHVGALAADDADFITHIHDRFAEEFAAADRFPLRTPGLENAVSQLRDSLDDEVAADFEALLDAFPSVGRAGVVNAVEVALLAAARQEELLYDISKWGEDTGLSSKATFSRTKTALEDSGLIDTEKEPIDVGRPRLRLLIGDDDLQDLSAQEFAEVLTERRKAQASN